MEINLNRLHKDQVRLESYVTKPMPKECSMALYVETEGTTKLYYENSLDM